eukprot:CAMPEP_0194246922 /NCGR_PEP_ID=MMETSP0158-20130606/15764_1 /TAXON_ID=33649 /ORGANISM="Thalassionema nitzschioides, Strain L26-B" /LENGTH=1541 /DNA_ID=CAMNT_0038982931 /DNA_START=31 /DNA_END=4656 /DNA_ORIENTATION=-
MVKMVDQDLDLKQTTLSFIELCEGGGDVAEQERLCNEILDELGRRTVMGEQTSCTQQGGQNDFIRTSMHDYNNKLSDGSAPSRRTGSVREIMGNMSSAELNSLAICLSDGMSYRLDPSMLLPATQDVEANEDALYNSAITLTRQSFLSAKLYLMLISLPGSWGAGLIDVSALSSLSSLVRRWSVECTGLHKSSTESQSQHAKKHKRKPATRDNDEISSVPSTKRYRVEEEISIASDDDEGLVDFSNIEINEDDDDTSGVITDPSVLGINGLRLASLLAQLPIQSDFVHWSEDATEVILDAVVCAMMTAAALQCDKNVGNKTMSTLCGVVLAQLTKSLLVFCKTLTVASYSAVTRIDHEHVDSNFNTVERVGRGRSSIVFILRGLFSILSKKVELPNGQKGKDAAHGAATKVLEEVVKTMSREVGRHSSRVLKAPYSSKSKTPLLAKTPVAAATPVAADARTPRTGRRKKRVSFGRVRGKSIERLAKPTLKEYTPMRKARASLGSDQKTPRASKHSPMIDVVVGMLQKLLTLSDLNRSDMRQQTIEVLIRCLTQLPTLDQLSFLRFVIQVCHSKLPVHRLASCELIGQVLSSQWFWDNQQALSTLTNAASPSSPLILVVTGKKSPAVASSPLAELEQSSLPQALVGCLKGRLSDKAPGVRARAAYSLVQVFESPRFSENNDGSEFHSTFESMMPQLLNRLADRVRLDEKATVRKAAITALSKAILYSQQRNPEGITLESYVELLGRLCSDQSLASRKAAAQALSDWVQLEHQNSDETDEGEKSSRQSVLEFTWTTCVVPLVLDSEPGCVQLALTLFHKVVFSPLVEGVGSGADGAWRILSCLSECTEEKGSNKTEYEALRTIARQWVERHNKDSCLALWECLRSRALLMLEDNDFQTEHEYGVAAVWGLFQAFTDQPKEILLWNSWIQQAGHGFVLESIHRMLDKSTKPSTNSITAEQYALRSCLHVAKKLVLPPDEARDLVQQLKDVVGRFEIGTEIITATVAVLQKHSSVSEQNDARISSLDDIRNDLFEKCESKISHIMESLSRGAVIDERDTLDTEKSLIRATYLCGELAMLGFSASSTNTNDFSFSKRHPRLFRYLQALLSKTLPGGHGDSNSIKRMTPESVRAHAFVTWGKLCLRSESLAQESLNLFARELHTSQDKHDEKSCVAVQSNALLVLGDLCFHYTHLVDRYLPVMAACLQTGLTPSNDEQGFLETASTQESAIVRQHAVLMLSSLLLQDYIKWRGLLFHRFLVATSDPDEVVTSLAEQTLSGPMLKKDPKLFLNRFVESILVLNHCTAHPMYQKAAAADDYSNFWKENEMKSILLPMGNNDESTSRARRYQIYKFMLQQMSDEEKLVITARLCKDILGAAVQSKEGGALGRVCRRQGGVESEEETAARQVLRDTFFLLTSSWLRVGRRSSENADDDIELGTSDQTKVEQVVAAKGRLLSRISSKHLVEILLPILCRLKEILQHSCSPLLKECMTFWAEIYQRYKSEVQEFLANDPTLLQEVEYDAVKYHKQKESHFHEGGEVQSVVTVK